MILSDLHQKWIAVNVWTRSEGKTAHQLSIRGYQVELPRLPARRRCTHPWDGNVLFPGYLFCRFDVNNPFPITTTPGVKSIVSAGPKIIPVPEDEILGVSIAAAAGRCEPCAAICEPGTIVEVLTGPLAGVRGKFLRYGGKGRLVISISILNRSVMTELYESDVVTPLAERTGVFLGMGAWSV